MSESVQIALIASIAPTIVAFGAIIATIVTSNKADGKLNQIHVLTNSTLTAANKRIDELEAIVKRLLVEKAENKLG